MLNRKRKTISRLLVMSLSMILALAIAGTAYAVEFRAGETITIGQGEVIDDDLAVSGNTIIVDGVVNGDLVAAGARVIINGRINGSLMMAGQTLELNGQVGGTVYSGAAALTIGPNAQVERSLFFGGYSYVAEPGSTIGRDSIAAGYQAVFNGGVRRNLQAYVSALELNGAVGGNVDAFVDRPGTIADTQFWGFFAAQGLPPALIPGLRVGPEATIGGQFRYTSPVEQTGAILARPEGGIVYSAPAPAATGATSVAAPSTARNESLEWFWVRLREFVSLLVIGGLALWLLPVWFNKVAERTQTQPWLAAVWGFVVGVLGYAGALLAAFLIILVVAGLAALTLGGLAMSVFSLGFSVLGLFFTLFSIFAAYGSKVVVLYPLSHTICERFAPSLNRYSFVPLGLGVLVFVLLRSIPFLGVLIEIGVTLVGLGALWLSFRAGYARPRPEAGALGTRPTLAPAPV
jgi:cytoskeletal protein CcmA (bactofilin family)